VQERESVGASGLLTAMEIAVVVPIEYGRLSNQRLAKWRRRFHNRSEQIQVDVNTIETVFCAVLPLNRVAEGDVIVYACVNGPREPVVVTSNEPAVPAGIETLLVIVMGVPETGVRVKLK
jgi:hypothetical protein